MGNAVIAQHEEHHQFIEALSVGDNCACACFEEFMHLEIAEKKLITFEVQFINLFAWFESKISSKILRRLYF